MADPLPKQTQQTHRKKPRSFWSFWGHGFNKARIKSWDKYSKILTGFGLFYTIFAAYLLNKRGAPVAKWIKEHWGDFDMSLWLTYIIPCVFLILFLIYHFARAPYEIYKEQFEKHEKEIEESDAQSSRLHAEIKLLNEKLAEKSEADKLVQDKLDAKNALGLHLLELNKRLYAAKQISRYDFQDKVKDDAWSETNKLFKKVEADLAFKLTLAEFSRFSITVGETVKEITDDPYFAQRFMDWRWHYNCILAKHDKLTEIIKELG